MPKGAQSRGTCMFCGYTTTKGSMRRHIEACAKRQELLAAQEAAGKPAVNTFYLRAQDAEDSRFWIDLELRGTDKLADIDRYLRGIWLECCGHLSEFMVGGWGSKELPMTRRIEQVYRDYESINHVYDFGTSSITNIKLVARRKGTPLTTKHPITLLARNLLPESVCVICGEMATHYCTECVIEDQNKGTLCTKHASDHPHINYGDPVLIFNSPRVGLCGYDGPAKPPY